MAARPLCAVLFAQLLAGAAALHSWQSSASTAAAADLEELEMLEKEEEEFHDLDWSVSQAMAKLDWPQPPGSLAKQAPRSAADGVGGGRWPKRTPSAWIFGTHHKSGTLLLRSVALAQAAQVGSKTCQNLGPYRPDLGWHPRHCQHHPEKYSTVFDSELNDEKAQGGYGFLEHGMEYRTVHIMRDPLAMVVSGYIYHHKSSDTPEPLFKERHMPMVDALALESRFVLEYTGHNMTTTYLATRDDPRVLHVRFEDFTRDSRSFDETVKRIYDFTVGGVVSEWGRGMLLAKMATQDLHRYPPQPGRMHVAKLADEKVVQSVLDGIPQDLLAELQKMRSQLGY